MSRVTLLPWRVTGNVDGNHFVLNVRAVSLIDALTVATRAFDSTRQLNFTAVNLND